MPRYPFTIKRNIFKQFQNSTDKFVEMWKIDTPSTQENDRSYSWLGSGTSIKVAGLE
jgi:hypothetical protein